MWAILSRGDELIGATLYDGNYWNPITYSLPGKPPEALTAEIYCFPRSVLTSWPPHSPVLIKISADNSPLNQFPVKNLFFSLIIKTFRH